MCKIKTRDYYHEIRLLQLSDDIIENNEKIELKKYEIKQDYQFITINLFMLFCVLILAYNESNIILLTIYSCCFSFNFVNICLPFFHILELNKTIKLLYKNNSLSLKLKFLHWKSQAA